VVSESANLFRHTRHTPWPIGATVQQIAISPCLRRSALCALDSGQTMLLSSVPRVEGSKGQTAGRRKQGQYTVSRVLRPPLWTAGSLASRLVCVHAQTARGRLALSTVRPDWLSGGQFESDCQCSRSLRCDHVLSAISNCIMQVGRCQHHNGRI